MFPLLDKSDCFYREVRITQSKLMTKPSRVTVAFVNDELVFQTCYIAFTDHVIHAMFQIYGIISLLFVVTSISGFCLETLPELKPELRTVKHSPNQTNVTTTSRGCDGQPRSDVDFIMMTPNPALQVLDTICTIFFTIELIVRFCFSPNKFKFVRSAMNIIDLLALVPLYMQLILNSDEYKFCYVNERLMIEIMFILRIIRMFRIFHLVKHYQALKILVYALKASVQELLMLGIFLFIGMLVFATMIYYAERKDAVHPSDVFSTIPIGFWWALITMTTVGYGDVTPKSPIGYVVGTACAVAGVLLVALTFPVISNNFTLFYTHVRSRSGNDHPQETSSRNAGALFHSEEGAKIYENARRTSNGSIILNTNRSFTIPRNTSAVTGLCVNGKLGFNGDINYGTLKDANSMAEILVKRDDSDYNITRTRSVKAHSDDGVMYAGEEML